MGNLNSEDKRPGAKPSTHPLGDLGSMREIIQKINRARSSPENETPGKTRLVLEQKPFVEESARAGQRDPFEIAEEMVRAARETSGARRVELARRAIQVHQDCADAYVILAEETARSLDAARHLYEEGVRAGERALGKSVIAEGPVGFGSAPGAQSYIRARTGLARCLWSLGCRQEAIGHCADLLRLDPSDDQGIRYLLVNWLLHEDLKEDLGSLFDAFENDKETSWLYTRALWAFCQEGACPEADGYLEEAFRNNPYIPSYLLGLKKMPGILPESVEPGDEREAVSYIAEALDTWLKTEGALEWLILTLPRALQRTRLEPS